MRFPAKLILTVDTHRGLLIIPCIVSGLICFVLFVCMFYFSPF